MLQSWLCRLIRGVLPGHSPSPVVIPDCSLTLNRLHLSIQAAYPVGNLSAIGLAAVINTRDSHNAPGFVCVWTKRIYATVIVHTAVIIQSEEGDKARPPSILDIAVHKRPAGIQVVAFRRSAV